MKLLTPSKSGVPLLDGEPIDGLLGFRLTQAAVDEPPVLETKISVRLNLETFLDNFVKGAT